MRLIDANELKKYIRRCDDSATRATFDYVHEDDIDDAPTVNVLEQIRAEIENLNCEYIDYNTGCSAYVSQNDVLQIINNHTKGDN